MAINKICIENFTVFDKIEMDFCRGINVFIGENGTGKTHILKIIHAFCECRINEVKRGLPTLLVNCFSTKELGLLMRNSLNSARFDFQIDITTTNHATLHYNYDLNNRKNSIMETRGDSLVKEIIPAIFIPAKEMLTHSGVEKDYMQRNLPFDITLIDILYKTGVSTLRNLPDEMKTILDRIAQIIGGKVLYKNDRYYIEKPNGELIDFAVEAEGFKKLGLIYRLIETGYLEKGSVLIWDEPEANLNPRWIPFVVEILFELSRRGVQIFAATHEYNLMKYFSIKKNDNGEVAFYGLHNNGNGVVCEREEDYDLLEYNAIINANTNLLVDEIERVL